MRAYLDLFHADTQPAELAELRRIAAALDGTARRLPAAPDRRGLARHGDAADSTSTRAVLRRLEVGRARADRPAHRLRRRAASTDRAAASGRRAEHARAEPRARRGGVHVAPHRARLRRPARRAAAAMRAGARPRRPGRAALAARRRHEPRAWSSWRRRRSPRRRSAPARPGARSRTPRRGAPRHRSTSGGSSSRASRRAPSRDGRLARPAAAAQLLGDLVRAVRRRDAAARPLRRRARAARLAGARAWPSTRPTRCVGSCRANACACRWRSPATTAWTCRDQLGNSGGGLAIHASLSTRPALRSSAGWALVSAADCWPAVRIDALSANPGSAAIMAVKSAHSASNQLAALRRGVTRARQHREPDTPRWTCANSRP